MSYRIENESFGLRIVMGPLLEKDEWRQFLSDIAESMRTMAGAFSVLVDARSFAPRSSEELSQLVEIVRGFVRHGGRRCAVVIESPIMKGQAVQVAHLADVGSSHRFFDAARIRNWEEVCISWLTREDQPSRA